MGGRNNRKARELIGGFEAPIELQLLGFLSGQDGSCRLGVVWQGLVMGKSAQFVCGPTSGMFGLKILRQVVALGFFGKPNPSFYTDRKVFNWNLSCC